MSTLHDSNKDAGTHAALCSAVRREPASYEFASTPGRQAVCACSREPCMHSSRTLAAASSRSVEAGAVAVPRLMSFSKAFLKSSKNNFSSAAYLDA